MHIKEMICRYWTRISLLLRPFSVRKTQTEGRLPFSARQIKAAFDFLQTSKNSGGSNLDGKIQTELTQARAPRNAQYTGC